MYEEMMHKQMYLNISMRGMAGVLEMCLGYAWGSLVQLYKFILFNKATYYQSVIAIYWTDAIIRISKGLSF